MRGEPLRAVLVVDMVASTRLRATLGDAAFEPIRERLARDLQVVVEEHGGEVLVGTGDGAEMAFPSATAAIEAAVALQRAVHRARAVWRTGEPVAYRMGVAVGSGDVARRRAHAVCAGQPADSIRLGPDVAVLAGTWLDRDLVDDVVLDDAGHAEVRWHPTTLGDAIGLPPGTGDVVSRFVGRDDLRRPLRQACLDTDRTRVVVLDGEAGVGKSELAAVVCADVVASGGSVLWGRCTDPSTGAYQPLVEALDVFLDRAPLASTWLGPAPEDLGRLAPRVHHRLGAPELPELDPETARLRALDALAAWVATVADQAPVVLVVDDVHWATATTRAALGHLLDRVPGLTLLLTRRSTEAHPALAAWLAETAGRADLEVHTLTGLDDDEAVRLVQAHAPDTPTDLARWVVDATRGNPFFVEQLSRHVASLASSDARTQPDIPTGLRQTIQGRLAASPEAAREVVQAAAVLGDEFDVPTLLALLDDDVVDDGLESALAAGVLREVDPATLRYRFVHGLTRQVAYEGLSGLRRARHHQRVHAALDALPERDRRRRLPELAHHALAAHALLGPEHALRDVVEAGRHLRRTLAPDVAADLLERAIPVLGDAETALVLRVEQAEALQDAGDVGRLAASDAAVALARRLGDGQAMARAVLARSRGLFSRALAVDQQEVGHLEAALAMTPETASGVRARLLSQLSMELAFAPDPDLHQRAAEAAIAAARVDGDAGVLGRVLAARLWTLFHPHADRLSVQADLDGLAAASGDEELTFWAAFHGAFTAVRTGDGRRARDEMGRALAAAERVDRPPIRWAVLHTVWLDALLRCRWDAAMAAADEQARLAAAMGNADAESAHRAQASWVAMETAPPDRVDAELTALAGRPGVLPHAAVCTYARHAAEQGHLELAAQLVRRAVDEHVVGDPRHQGHLMDVVQLLEAALAVGDEPTSAHLRGQLEGREDEHAAIVFATAGSTRRVLGLARARDGDHAGAVAYLEAAIAANDAAGARAWAARARLDLADLLRGLDPARGDELHATALADADRLGLTAVARRAAGRRMAG